MVIGHHSDVYPVSLSSTAVAMKIEYNLELVFSRDLIWQNQTHLDIIIDLNECKIQTNMS